MDQLDCSKPWRFWTEEERTYVIKQAYLTNFLIGSEIKTYLLSSRIHTIALWSFPLIGLATYQYIVYPILKPILLYSRHPKIFGPLAVILGWVVWAKYNPFLKIKNQQKIKVLQTIQDRLGLKMKVFNDIIPRYQTVNELDRQLRKKYNQKNGIFAGYLYPQEDNFQPIYYRPYNIKKKSFYK